MVFITFGNFSLNWIFSYFLDGLIDCQDPECCEESVCKGSQLCATVARPIDILLQRQPPASTASFFQKMRFIIEEGSLQRYAKNTAFNERYDILLLNENCIINLIDVEPLTQSFLNT